MHGTGHWRDRAYKVNTSTGQTRSRTTALFLAIAAITLSLTSVGNGPDRATAASSAPVAVLDQWTATTQVYRNADQSLSATIGAGPIQALDPASSTGWSPLDTTLVTIGGAVQPKLVNDTLSFSPGGTGTTLASVESDGVSLSMDWPGTLVPPILAGNSATYANALTGINLVLQARPQGFEVSYLVAAPPLAPLVLELPLHLTGITASLTEGGMLVLTDPDGVIVDSADPARMWGAARDPNTNEPTVSALVATSLVTTESGQVLRLRPDPAFFTTPGISYPVTVDPAGTLSLVGDTYVSSGSPTTGFPTDPELKVGPATWPGLPVSRSLLVFNVDPITWGHVTAASLDLWENWSFSCLASIVDLWSVTEAFDQTVTWNTQPAVGTKYASLNVAKGFSALCPADTVSFTSGGTGGLTFTNLAQSWADDIYSFPAVEIRSSAEGNPQTWKKFNSSAAGTHPPLLHVTYNHAPTSLHFSGGGMDTVMLHGTFVDPDGGTGSVQYTVYDDLGATVFTASGTTVATGSDSTYDIPDGVLQSTRTYTWKARGFDGTDYSAFSSLQTLPPDLCGPTSASSATATYKLFKTSPTGTSIPILLDQYNPNVAPGTPEPAVVMVHGGGWTQGCRRLLDTEAIAFAKAGYIVFTVDYRLACSGYEPGYSAQVLAMCGWYFQRQTVETGIPGAAAEDVQDAIKWVRGHVSSYWAWNGRIAAVGASAGGNILLQAIATTSDPEKKPDVAGTWSGKIEMGQFVSPPDDGIASADTCDHSHKDGPNFSGVKRCWTGEDFYLNSLDYSQTPPNPPAPVCGFPIDQAHTKVCADAQEWLDAAPYTQWNAGSHSTLPPVFFSNAGGPDPNIYVNAETVPLQEAIEFRNLLVLKGFLQGVDMDFCVVDSKLHGSKYLFDPALSCEIHPGEFVFTSTLNFFNRFTRP